MSQVVKRDYFDQIRSLGDRTPDFKELKNGKNDEFLVFIYGAMKRGKPLHNMVLGANYYGKAVTTGSNYLLRKTAAGGSPILFDIDRRWTKSGMFITPDLVGKIEGEVYGVPLRCITKLDTVEDNGVSVKRESRYVRFKENPQSKEQIVSCFIYLADRDFWEETTQNFLTLPSCVSCQTGGEKFFYYI